MARMIRIRFNLNHHNNPRSLSPSLKTTCNGNPFSCVNQKKQAMKFLYSALAFVLCAGILSCKKDIQYSQGLIDIGTCSNRTIGSKTVQICFEELLEDSRCPANANCIWQGVARAKFLMKLNGNETSFDLSTTDLSPHYVNERTIMGYKVRLINIFPYPGLGTGPLQAEVEISE